MRTSTFVAFVLACTSLAPARSAPQQPLDASKVPGAPPVVPTSLPPAQGSLLAGWSDDFNRPNAPDLGPDWTLQGGSIGINNGHGLGTGGAVSWSIHNAASASYDSATASVDFLPPAAPGIVFVACVLGVGAGFDNLFMKVQDNVANGTYNRVYFYRGINGGSWSGSFTFPLATPGVTQGRMTCYVSNAGDTANIDLDYDFDGVPEEHFECHGILASGMALGTQTALSTYRDPEFDDWTFGDPLPPNPVVYCTPGTTTNGCAASIAASANPDVAHSTPCQISLQNVEGAKTGIVFYGLQGGLQPWCSIGGTSLLCVKAPTMRTGVQSTGGTTGQCNGTMTLDWNAFQLATPAALGAPWIAGEKAFVQGWFRDPPACKTTSLSDAVELTYAP
jgi:hypothetical protein